MRTRSLTTKEDQLTENAPQQSQTFAMMAELILIVISYLPLSDVKKLQQVNKTFHRVCGSFFNSTKLGPFPLSIWINNILPFLQHKPLKMLQRVSTTSKSLTMSSPRFLFISSHDPEKVNKFIGELSPLDLSSWRQNTNSIPSPPFLHPILAMEELLWVRGEPLETAETGLCRRSVPLVESKASRENASHPAVTRLVLEGMILDGDAYFNGGGSLMEEPEDEDEWEKTPEYSASGTGPGGVVTVLDVVKAVVNVTNRYPQYHAGHFDCFGGVDEAFINRQGQLVIAKVNWHS